MSGSPHDGQNTRKSHIPHGSNYGGTVNYLPSSLLTDGKLEGRREDYWAITGRLAMRWPQRPDGPRLRAGIEIGYAPERPTAAAVHLTEDPGGLSWDVALSFMDFRPTHSIGVN